METSPFKTFLLIGGSGSFGCALTTFLLAKTDATIRIYSRGELLQAQMQERFAAHADRLRWFIGDVRDLARLQTAMVGVDVLYHAAALKRIDALEYNPSEAVATNIQGTINVLTACRTMGVTRAIFVGTDKGVRPISCYGASKLLAERLWTRASAYDPHGTTFVATRWANVVGSRGSVLEVWQQQLETNKPLTLTNPFMTRFFLSLEEAVQCAWFALHYGQRGCILVPHLPAYRVSAFAEAVIQEYAPSGRETVAIAHIGIRGVEKLHESLLTDEEAETALTYTADGPTPRYYAIPPVAPSWAMSPVEAWPVPPGGVWQRRAVETPYRSDVWSWRLSTEELRARLREVS